MMNRTFDVIIVGAGPGGSGTAAFLAASGLDVLLLDKFEFPRDKTCGDALSPTGASLLGKLGIKRQLERYGYPVDGVTFTSPEGETVQAGLPRKPDLPKHAYVLKRFLLDDLIRQAAVDAGARYQGQVHIRGVHEEVSDSLVVLGDRHDKRIHYHGRMVVLAVGASTRLLKTLGLAPKTIRFSYAARAYFEGVEGLGSHIHIRFDSVPLPGYGWIFPLGSGEANVGAGYYRRNPSTPPTAAATLAMFLKNPSLKPLLGGARRVSPIKAFPIRTDFHRSPSFGQRKVLVGEAVGLVNPFTGEGIDYALESAHLASETILSCFREGDFSLAALRRYDRVLRDRFQRLFVLTHRVRDLYMNSFLLNPLVRACRRWPEVTSLLVNVLLSYDDPAKALRPGIFIKVLRSMRPVGQVS